MSEKTRFALCMGCGELKATDLYDEGNPVCDDCHEAGQHSSRFRVREDGYYELREDYDYSTTGNVGDSDT